jgi:4-amino-4-deoxy-L-arabinose transferase-like glycosyltransferase
MFDVAHPSETTKTPERALDRRARQIRLAFWLFAVLAGAYQAWVFRNTITSDGISYLDMADNIAHGQWMAAINGYWSPLYPLVLALALVLAKPAACYEFAIVHAANFVVYLFALASFDFLIQRLVLRTRRAQPAWLLLAAGYAVAVWGLLELITITSTSPDMVLAAFVFLACGILLKIESGTANWRYFAVLGALLGCGYLAKAPMFLLAFVFIALTFIAPGRFMQLLPKSLIALLAFLTVAAPYVIALSKNKDRPTFGDSGKLNYAWYVDGASYRHWQGEPLGARSEVAPRWSKSPMPTGIPVHPTRKVLDTPGVYEFGGPVGGTYPVWYDPSYWNEGLVPHFDLSQQVRKILVNLKFMYSLLLNIHVIQLYREGQWFRFFSPLLLAAWLVLFWRTRKSFTPFGSATRLLFVLSGAALGMYALVYCEPRHLAPFIVLLYLGLFSAIRLPLDSNNNFIKPLAAAILAAFALTVGVSIARLKTAPFEAWQVARTLQQADVGPGTKIASLEYANHGNVKWARLARCRIVAEIYTDAFAPKDPYWQLDPTAQARVLAAFIHASADIVVASNVPEDVATPAGWKRIGDTRYFFYRLRRSSDPAVTSLAKL